MGNEIMIQRAALFNADIKIPFKKAILEFHVSSIKGMDMDNRIASFKGIIDGLVKMNVLEDDTFKQVQLEVFEIPVHKKGEESITIIIKEVA